MDVESHYALKFFEAFLSVHRMFTNATILVGKQPQVKQANTMFGHRASEEPRTRWFDLAVFAELHNGNTLDWYLEVSWDDRWLFQYSVNKHELNEDGSHSIIDFPSKEAEDLKGATNALLDAARQLLDTIKCLDLAGQ